jgi:hypothetical protein
MGYTEDKKPISKFSRITVKRNVRINWKIGLTSLVETFWAIGTSIAAAGVLQTHRQAHCLVARADTRPKPAKELALPTHGQTGIKHETLSIIIRNAG